MKRYVLLVEKQRKVDDPSKRTPRSTWIAGNKTNTHNSSQKRDVAKEWIQLDFSLLLEEKSRTLVKKTLLVMTMLKK